MAQDNDVISMIQDMAQDNRMDVISMIQDMAQDNRMDVISMIQDICICCIH
jgi:hypothetical protein